MFGETIEFGFCANCLLRDLIVVKRKAAAYNEDFKVFSMWLVGRTGKWANLMAAFIQHHSLSSHTGTGLVMTQLCNVK